MKQQCLQVSAKSSTFAPQMAEKMRLEEMKHTSYRCRKSAFMHRGLGLVCTQTSRYCDEKKCAVCEEWQPSLLAENYFNGNCKNEERKILTAIYLERMKKGTF